jgi:signal transduction histidine kinase/DNA-binding response OmpR family regulator
VDPKEGEALTVDKASILLVDDLPDKLLVLQTVLEELDQNLVTVRSGEEALRRILEQDFAVILLDINMPGMDGLETAGYIRRRKKSAHTPIIFVTAYADEVHTARGYSLGAVDYIFAPVSPEVLRTKVKVFVDLFLMTQQVRRQAEEQVALAHEQAARAAAEDATRRSAFLAEASIALSSTLDFGATLKALARHVVPFLADLAMVSGADEQGCIGPVELAWTQTGNGVCSATIDANDQPMPSVADAIRNSLKQGKMLHLVDAGPWPAPRPPASETLNGTPALPPAAGTLRSLAILPLVAHGRTLGVMTLALGPSGRAHDAADLVLASDLAARAATALDNARLYQNIQQEDRRKNEFLAMLAHELRNPLAPIRNAVGVLKILSTQEPTIAKVRDMIERQVTHMVRLVDDLLDVSRLARGKVLLRNERLDLSRLVRETAEDYRTLLAANRLTLEIHLPDEPVQIIGDATRLSQVLSNLLHNASKFTDAGGSICVELRTETGDDGGAVLTVRDTGIGMDRNMLERVFETFSQADSSLDRSRGGLGLGLSLVRGLVELHGGETRAESEGLGKGTAITIRLPLAGPGGLPRQQAVAPDMAACANRVLVIEDNVDTAESMRILFSLTGHEVEVAHAGRAGLDAIQTFRPQVVLCDIGLPGGMDGYAVARAIRRDTSLAAIRLIAVSGYGREEDRRQSREAGFDAHLIKPVDFTELRRLLSAPDPAI